MGLAFITGFILGGLLGALLVTTYFNQKFEECIEYVEDLKRTYSKFIEWVENGCIGDLDI